LKNWETYLNYLVTPVREITEDLGMRRVIFSPNKKQHFAALLCSLKSSITKIDVLRIEIFALCNWRKPFQK
jgi:hypothetical protein